MTGKIEVPEEAVEVAAIAFHGAMDGPVSFPEDWHGEIRAALEAAAPFIAAKALEDAADRIMGPSDVLLDGATCRWNAMELRERAAAVRGEG